MVMYYIDGQSVLRMGPREWERAIVCKHRPQGWLLVAVVSVIVSLQAAALARDVSQERAEPGIVDGAAAVR